MDLTLDTGVVHHGPDWAAIDQNSNKKVSLELADLIA